VDAKQWEPLLTSGAAVVIDTTDLTITEVVVRMEECLAASSRRRDKA
jgi:cytidylate kinase